MAEELNKLLHEKKEVELVNELSNILKSGTSVSETQELLNIYKKTLNKSIESDYNYIEYLDDLIASLEGFCDVNFKLHPNNFKKDV